MRKLMQILISVMVIQTVLQAQPGWREREDLLEDFEQGIPFGWLVLDEDDSGTSWTTVSRDEGFLTYGDSPCAAGCRYNNDGSQNDDWLITPRMIVPDSSRIISFWAASQDLDPQYLESFEILISRTRVDENNFTPALFEEVASYHQIPSTLTQYTFDTAPDFLGDSIQVAIRCVSQDDYYLIVDHFQGLEIAGETEAQLYTWPTVDQHLDLGPFPVEATVNDTVWVGNQGGDTLIVRVMLPGTAVDTTVLLSAFHLASVPFSLTSTIPERIERGINIFWGPDSAFGNLLQSGYSGLAYYEDDFYTREDFESQSIPEGWSAGYHHADSPGWQVAEHSSSSNFAIPSHSWYAFINSDAQGEDATQDDWLISTPLELPEADELLYLTWASYFDELYGSAGSLLWTSDPAPSPDSDWNVIHNESGTDTVWTTEWFRIPESLWSETIQLGFHFTGQNSQGWAIDDLQLISDSVAEKVEPGSLPQALQLLPPYPNPFNAELTVPLQLSTPALTRLQLYDLLGRLVWQKEVHLTGGYHTVQLQPARLSSGVYFLRGSIMEQGNVAQMTTTRKVMLLK